MNLISPKLQQNLRRSVSPSSQFSGHLQQSVPSPGGPPAGLAGSSGGERGGPRRGEGEVWEEGCIGAAYTGCCKRARERPREILGPSRSRKV